MIVDIITLHERSGYAMRNDTRNALKIPEGQDHDPLTAVLQRGAKTLLAQAIEAEVESFVAKHAMELDAQGPRHVVRNGPTFLSGRSRPGSGLCLSGCRACETAVGKGVSSPRRFSHPTCDAPRAWRS